MAPKKKPEYDPARLLREFSGRLARIRRWKGLTQTELANAIDVRQATISKWEAGEVWPPMESMIRMAAFFEISLEAFVFGARTRQNVRMPHHLLAFDE